MSDPRVTLRTPAGKRYWLLYGITGITDGRMVYIGQTSLLFPIRWALHVAKLGSPRAGQCRLLSEFLLQHGPENFQAVPLASALSKVGANHLERALIEQWDTLHPQGLNEFGSESYRMKQGSAARNGYTPLRRAAVMEAMNVRWADPVQRERMLQTLTKARNSPARSAALRGNTNARGRSPENQLLIPF